MDEWKQEYYQMIDDCIARESKLTDWERKFIDDIQARLANMPSLSIKQQETIERIWERATKHG